MRGFHNKAGDIVTNNNEDKMASLSSISSYLALVNILSTIACLGELFKRSIHLTLANCPQKTKTHPFQGGFGQWVGFGAPGRTRTCSLLIRSQTLCPLSYGRLRLDNSIAHYDRDGNLVMPTLVTAMTYLTISANENVKPPLPALPNLSYLVIDIIP